MRTIELAGLRVALGEPRPVCERVGHLWFPNLARFPNGDLMLTAILTADSHDNPVNGSCISGSTDGGATWTPFYDMAGWPGGPHIPQSDGSLAVPEYYVYPDPLGQARAFSGHFDHFADAARRFAREPYALRVEGLPRDVHIHGEGGKWGKLWPAALVSFGNYVEQDGHLLTTTYLRYARESRYTAIALTSADRGRTWRYLATVAASDTAPDAQEGPNESGVVRLANGDLMCVMRVGRDAAPVPQPLHRPLARAYSADGGATWSAADRLPIAGVAPCVRRLGNGVLALSTGRPGIALWLSDDPRGESWQAIDLLAYHNAALDERHHIRPGQGGFHPDDPDQTTAYTEFVEVAPGRLLLVYDRIPLGWRGVPVDSVERNRIYLIEIAAERR